MQLTEKKEFLLKDKDGQMRWVSFSEMTEDQIKDAKGYLDRKCKYHEERLEDHERQMKKQIDYHEKKIKQHEESNSFFFGLWEDLKTEETIRSKSVTQ